MVVSAIAAPAAARGRSVRSSVTMWLRAGFARRCRAGGRGSRRESCGHRNFTAIIGADHTAGGAPAAEASIAGRAPSKPFEKRAFRRCRRATASDSRARSRARASAAVPKKRRASAAPKPASRVASRKAAPRSAALISASISSAALRRQAEAQVDGGEQPRLDRLVGVADHRLERRDHVADHVFRRVVQQDREPRPPVEPRRARPRHRLDQQRVLRDREDMRAVGLAVPARDAREPVRDVLDLDVERRGVEQVEPPARQHALPGARSTVSPGRCALRLRPRSSGRFAACRCARHALVAVALHQMVVDHADRLHEGIDDGRADELEAARRKLLGHLPRQRGLGRHLLGVAEAG